ncbi:MAG: ABC transporter permease [Gaiellaceae bacterium]
MSRPPVLEKPVAADPPPAASAPLRGSGLGRRIVREVVTGGAVAVTVLALVLALLVGAVVIAASDPAAAAAWRRVTSDPGRALAASWDAIADAYGALLRGALLEPASVSAAVDGGSIANVFGPISETLVAATPLILAGLSVTIAFRAGLFNIGGQGQAMLGAAAGAFVGFHWQLPAALHLAAALLAGVAAGAAWGLIPGFLKARTGAHEVITTIMLNYVAVGLVLYLLSKPIFLREGRTDPLSPEVAGSARLPQLAGETLRLHLGILVALAVAAAMLWLLRRTTIGFSLRIVSLNEDAARTAGVSVSRAWVLGMVLAGALAGLAGAVEILGTDYALVPSSAASLGFLGISVALLGRATVGGTVLASLLYGAFEAGGVRMQAATATPFDIVTVIQALTVLFVAAPQLVRAVFRLRARPIEAPAGRGW